MKVDVNYQPKNNELKDKVILVTGATQGLGKACSIDLAKAGASIILLGRDLSALEDTYDEITSKDYPEPILYPLDLLGATPQDYQTMLEAIVNKLGRLDGIVHNAATIGTMMTLEQYDVKTWYEVMQVNLHAPFLLTQVCLPLLLKAKDARLIFITDKSGRQPKAYWGAYGISKSALETMMTTLADELEATNICINSLDPGNMRTSLHTQTHPGQNMDKVPIPDTVSPGIVYLFSQEAKYLNKQQLSA